MLFGRRRAKNDEATEALDASGEELIESAKTSHGRFTLIPRAKQLVNGNWIIRITLEETTDLGPRVYDFAGPMVEYGTRDEAVQGGIEHAKRRLDEGY